MSELTSNPDELLSASLDGELTLPEQERVAALLESSPQARDTLQDFRELSTLLKSLPRPAAPPELRAGVMQRIASERPAPQPPRRPTRLILSVASTVGVAACLVVAVVLLSQPADHEIVAIGNSPPEHAPAASASAIAVASAPHERQRAVDEADVRMPSRHPLDQTEAAESATARMAERLRLNPLDPPSPGEVRHYLTQVGSDTVIVEVGVVDVDAFADEMVVLLQRRGLTVVEADTETGEISGRSVENSGSELVALYVEASDEQLTGVVDDLMQHVSFDEVRAANIAAGDQRLAQRLRGLSGRSMVLPPAPESTSPTPRPLMQPTAEPPSVAGASPSAEPAARLPRAEEIPAESTAEAAAVPTRAAQKAAAREWSVRVNLPEELYRELRSEADAAWSGRGESRAATTARPLADSAEPRPEAFSRNQQAVRERPVDRPDEVSRVLFIVQSVNRK